MKVGIFTIYDNWNYGNRLQNYALQEVLKKLGCDVVTLKNIPYLNDKKKFLLRYLKYYVIDRKKESVPKQSFIDFNKFINFSSKYVTPLNINRLKLDKYVVGSDQVWNPNFFRLRDLDMLSCIDNNKKIAYAASFGVSKLDEQSSDKVKKNFSINKFKNISVREEKAKQIIEDLTNRDDIEVLVDPTLLLSSTEWDKVLKKPKNLNADKYIFTYFLGNLSDDKKKEIERIAFENNCEIIDILDKNSKYYECGPSEFLYLEKNAFLICTDSFHSSVFSIIYNRPFVVFERDDKEEKMNSRIDTLIKKFMLENRKFEGKISDSNLNHDYTFAYEILEKEREKSKKFLFDNLI